MFFAKIVSVSFKMANMNYIDLDHKSDIIRSFIDSTRSLLDTMKKQKSICFFFIKLSIGNILKISDDVDVMK